MIDYSSAKEGFEGKEAMSRGKQIGAMPAKNAFFLQFFYFSYIANLANHVAVVVTRAGEGEGC